MRAFALGMKECTILLSLQSIQERYSIVTSGFIHMHSAFYTSCPLLLTKYTTSILPLFLPIHRFTKLAICDDVLAPRSLHLRESNMALLMITGWQHERHRSPEIGFNVNPVVGKRLLHKQSSFEEKEITLLMIALLLHVVMHTRRTSADTHLCVNRRQQKRLYEQGQNSDIDDDLLPVAWMTTHAGVPGAGPKKVTQQR